MMNNDKVKRFFIMPQGWKRINGAQNAPCGWVWINNGMSPFSDQYQHALLKV